MDDVLNDCWSCGVFQTFFVQAKTYSELFFAEIGPHLVSLLIGILALWIVWTAVEAMMGKYVNWEQILLQFIRFLLVFAILSTGKDWWMLAEAMLNAAAGASVIAFKAVSAASVNTAGPPEVALSAILGHAEIGLRDRFWDGLVSVASDLRLWSNGLVFLMSLCMIIVFVGLIYVFVKSFFAAVVKIMSLFILSPFWIALGAFSATWGTTIAALRMLLMACLQLVMASGSVGLMAAILGNEPLGATTTGDAATFLSSNNVIEKIVTGFLFLMFYAEIVALPGQVLQVLDYKLASGRPMQWAAGKAGGFVGRSAANAAAAGGGPAALAARAGSRMLQDKPMKSWLRD